MLACNSDQRAITHNMWLHTRRHTTNDKRLPTSTQNRCQEHDSPKATVNVLGGGSGDIGNGVVNEDDESSEDEFVPHNLHIPKQIREALPTKAFFSNRLETAIAPRHAYLTLHGDTLPYGKELLNTDSSHKTLLLEHFLE